MKKETILFIIIFFLLSAGLALAEEPAKRVLEIVYPEIPGVPTPKYVDVGLPDYVNYIFRFAIVFFGLLILGILIYNGVKYLISFGNPSKLSDAKQGMIAALLGGLILFGAFIVFNTINPKLVNLELPKATLIKAVVVPGVYLCNYSVPGIEGILNSYMQGDLEMRKEAAKQLRERMGKAEKPKEGVCFLVNFSGILTNFTLRPGSNQTIFIIPEEKYNSETKKFDWQWSYGFVLHENDKFTGKCRLYPRPPLSGPGFIYRQVDNFKADMEFVAKAITVFKKPLTPPLPESEGVILYEGLGFNEIGWEGTTGKKKDGSGCIKNEECESNNCVPFDPKKPEEGGMCTPKGGTFLPSSLLAGISEVLAAADPNYLRVPFSPGEADVLVVNEDELKKEREVAGGKKKALYHNTRSMEIKPKNGFIAILLGDEKEGTKGEANEKCEVRKTDDANLMDDSIGRCGTCGIIGWATNWTGITKCYPCLESLIVVKGQAL